ncbi:flagellar filament capping protein FliD [Trinickia dinghuensis]|uniref:Flagellar hook-associated protein 2 n=1 Tax=Trinickia dinghuensis TaxID=2291023 RepID=A0A3D8JWH1_9BURK|nr:flagellar filament capping protein FliD [Trinickia dinghuensis]RDU97419.1 flagellar hook protein FliD [Trinickia dinghuensis]
MSSVTSPSSNSNTQPSPIQQAAQSILSGATGSSLDVNTLVQVLVNAKTAGHTAVLAHQQQSDNAVISALSAIKSVLSSLKTSLTGLADGSVFSQFAATASGKGIEATATAAAGAAAGSYSVFVEQLAAANQISSKAFTRDATLGTGTLTIGVGSGSMSIELDSKNNTLAGLAQAINGAADNPGVTAAVVKGSDGEHLVLTSKQTGAANTVSVSAGAGVDANLATANFKQVTAAQDAKLTVSGNPVTSASNVVKDALTGVTLTLTSPAVGTTQTVGIESDTTAIGKAVQGFADAYNAWVSAQKAQSAYDPTTRQAAPLLGDSMLNSAVNSIGRIMSSGVSVGGKTYSLAQIGLDLQHDGTLAFSSSKLQSSLKSEPTGVSSVFNGTNGIGQQLDKLLNEYTLSTIGQLDKRSASINDELTSITKQQSDLTTYQQTLTAQYNAQFNALNRLLTTVSNNKTYLNQLFGGNGAAGTLNKRG